MFLLFIDDSNQKTNDSVEKETAKKNFDKYCDEPTDEEKLRLDSVLNVVANIKPTSDILEDGISEANIILRYK